MNTLIRGGAGAILAMSIGLASYVAGAAAASKPDATISFHGGGVGFIAGVNWGSGTLHYHGKNYPLKVSGLDVGTIGANGYNASGEVYKLKKVSDIEGDYAAVGAAATAVKGAGVLDMSNGAGVEIKARSSSSGLDLKLGPSGMKIKLKK
jgi:hypothetical protein